MTNAHERIEQAVNACPCGDIPARVREIAERHRQTLLELANALLAAGRCEDEVVSIIQQASESFSSKLKAQTEEFPS